MNDFKHFRGRGRGQYQHNNFRGQPYNNIRRGNPNAFPPLLPLPPYRERWPRPKIWRGRGGMPPYLRPAAPIFHKPPPVVERPPSPLPGSEEARQRAIAEASARIQQQLNLTDPLPAASAQPFVHSASFSEQIPVPAFTSFTDTIPPVEVEPMEQTRPPTIADKVKKKVRRQSELATTSTVEELRNKILNQFNSMSKGKIQNLVNNPGSSKYDNYLHHLVRDMRLHLSQELRTMYNNREEEASSEMIDRFNSIVPDLGVELVSLPDTMVAELSKILQFDVNMEATHPPMDTPPPQLLHCPVPDLSIINSNSLLSDMGNSFLPNMNSTLTEMPSTHLPSADSTLVSESNDTYHELVEPEDIFKQAETLLLNTNFLEGPIQLHSPDSTLSLDPFINREPLCNEPPPALNMSEEESNFALVNPPVVLDLLETTDMDIEENVDDNSIVSCQNTNDGHPNVDDSLSNLDEIPLPDSNLDRPSRDASPFSKKLLEMNIPDSTIEPERERVLPLFPSPSRSKSPFKTRAQNDKPEATIAAQFDFNSIWVFKQKGEISNVTSFLDDVTSKNVCDSTRSEHYTPENSQHQINFNPIQLKIPQKSNSTPCKVSPASAKINKLVEEDISPKKSRLSLDERIKMMMKMQETTTKDDNVKKDRSKEKRLKIRQKKEYDKIKIKVHVENYKNPNKPENKIEESIIDLTDVEIKQEKPDSDENDSQHSSTASSTKTPTHKAPNQTLSTINKSVPAVEVTKIVMPTKAALKDIPPLDLQLPLLLPHNKPKDTTTQQEPLVVEPVKKLTYADIPGVRIKRKELKSTDNTQEHDIQNEQETAAVQMKQEQQQQTVQTKDDNQQQEICNSKEIIESTEHKKKDIQQQISTPLPNKQNNENNKSVDTLSSKQNVEEKTNDSVEQIKNNTVIQTHHQQLNKKEHAHSPSQEISNKIKIPETSSKTVQKITLIRQNKTNTDHKIEESNLKEVPYMSEENIEVQNKTDTPEKESNNKFQQDEVKTQDKCDEKEEEKNKISEKILEPEQKSINSNLEMDIKKTEKNPKRVDKTPEKDITPKKHLQKEEKKDNTLIKEDKHHDEEKKKADKSLEKEEKGKPVDKEENRKDAVPEKAKEENQEKKRARSLEHEEKKRGRSHEKESRKSVERHRERSLEKDKSQRHRSKEKHKSDKDRTEDKEKHERAKSEPKKVDERRKDKKTSEDDKKTDDDKDKKREESISKEVSKSKSRYQSSKSTKKSEVVKAEQSTQTQDKPEICTVSLPGNEFDESTAVHRLMQIDLQIQKLMQEKFQLYQKLNYANFSFMKLLPKDAQRNAVSVAIGPDVVFEEESALKVDETSIKVSPLSKKRKKATTHSNLDKSVSDETKYKSIKPIDEDSDLEIPKRMRKRRKSVSKPVPVVEVESVVKVESPRRRSKLTRKSEPKRSTRYTSKEHKNSNFNELDSKNSDIDDNSSEISNKVVEYPSPKTVDKEEIEDNNKLENKSPKKRRKKSNFISSLFEDFPEEENKKIFVKIRKPEKKIKPVLTEAEENSETNLHFEETNSKNSEIISKNEVSKRIDDIIKKNEEVIKRTEELANKNEETSQKCEDISKKTIEAPKNIEITIPEDIAYKGEEPTLKTEKLKKKPEETIKKIEESSSSENLTKGFKELEPKSKKRKRRKKDDTEKANLEEKIETEQTNNNRQEEKNEEIITNNNESTESVAKLVELENKAAKSRLAKADIRKEESEEKAVSRRTRRAAAEDRVSTHDENSSHSSENLLIRPPSTTSLRKKTRKSDDETRASRSRSRSMSKESDHHKLSTTSKFTESSDEEERLTNRKPRKHSSENLKPCFVKLERIHIQDVSPDVEYFADSVEEKGIEEIHKIIATLEERLEDLKDRTLWPQRDKDENEDKKEKEQEEKKEQEEVKEYEKIKEKEEEVKDEMESKDEVENEEMKEVVEPVKDEEEKTDKKCEEVETDDVSNVEEVKEDKKTESEVGNEVTRTVDSSGDAPLTEDDAGLFCSGHHKSILDIKILGDEFLAASEDGIIYKYCLRSGELQDAYTGHKRAVTCIYVVDVPAQAPLLYSGSLDCTLRCYNLDTAEVLHVVSVSQAIQCMDAAWGYIFLGTYEGLLFIYNMKKRLLHGESLTIASATVLMMRATTEGSRQVLILASRKREIMVRDAFTGLLLRTMCHEQRPTVYSLLLDRSLVYCGTSDKGILILDFNNGTQRGVYNSGKGVVCMVLYKTLLFAGCYDGLIYVYNTRTQAHVRTLPGPGEGMLLSLAISHGMIIAGTKKDHLLKIWKIPQDILNEL